MANPDREAFNRAVKTLREHLKRGQLTKKHIAEAIAYQEKRVEELQIIKQMFENSEDSPEMNKIAIFDCISDIRRYTLSIQYLRKYQKNPRQHFEHETCVIAQGIVKYGRKLGVIE